MIDRKDFNQIKKDMEQFEIKREALIRKSRDVLRLSKKVIYEVHRDEFEKAEGSIKEIKKEFNELNKIADKSPELIYSGSYKVAAQEFVEALSFFNLIKNKELLNSREFKFPREYYLLGLCDLSGEVFRKSIKYTIKGDYKKVVIMKDFIEELYNQLLLMDLRNGELRKKVDGINYDLKKFEELVLGIKFKK